MALGTRFGYGLTQLYAEFFHFPFLLFERDLDIYIAAGGISAGAAVLGALKAVWGALDLAPAVAMQPPAPPAYRKFGTGRLGSSGVFSQLTMMALRHILRWPLRAAFTSTGVGLAVSLLIVSLFSLDSVEHMIDVGFTLSQRQDAFITLSNEQNIRVLQAVERLPGVMRVEPYRSVLVRLRNGPYERKLAISGKPSRPQLGRVVDTSLTPIDMPPIGLMVDERVAEILHIQRGDVVDVEILGGWRGSQRADANGGTTQRGSVKVPVTDIVRSYFGLTAYMSINALNALLDEGPIISGVYFAYDANQEVAVVRRDQIDAGGGRGGFAKGLS